MRILMDLLASLAGLYSLLILIRIMLTWFGGAHFGRPAEILARITDPYLDWWSRTFPLRTGFLDLSPIMGMAALSVAQSIFSTVARFGRISIGIVLAIGLSAVWSAVSFLLGFCVIILVLRFIAFMINSGINHPFWRIIDAASRPILYRINRTIFGKRPVNYLTGIVVSIAVLVALLLGGGLAARLLGGLLLASPL